MASTITAFYSFSPNTTAESAQVNNNFSLIRGTLIPIHESTATGQDNNHDLGTNDYRWANTKVAGYHYLGVPSVSGWRIGQGDTTATLVFQEYSTSAYVTRFSMGE